MDYEDDTVYICTECHKKCKQPNVRHSSYEMEYGVASMFPDSHSCTILICPHCGEENTLEPTDDTDEM